MQATQHVSTEHKVTENTEEADGVDVAGESVDGMGGIDDEGETKPMED